MKKLRITHAGWENFTGWLGPVRFENSVSVEPTTPQIINQLAAAVSMVEFDEDGVETIAGVAHAMAEGRGLSYLEPTVLVPVTQAELDAEKARELATKGKPPIEEFHTSESLLKIADELGMAGIREIAKPWGVKDRSIPKLIHAILVAQHDFQKLHLGEALVVGADKSDDVVVEGDAELVTLDAEIAADNVQSVSVGEEIVTTQFKG